MEKNVTMTQEKYDAIQAMMQFGRIFLDQMGRIMEHQGFDDEGWMMNVCIHKTYCKETDETVYGTVQMFDVNQAMDNDSFMYRKNEFYTIKLGDGKGWVVAHDPVVKPGATPPEVRIRKAETGVPESRKEEKPYPPFDGYWIGYFDCPDVVDSGVQMK